jgi:hypothetical protein
MKIVLAEMRIILMTLFFPLVSMSQQTYPAVKQMEKIADTMHFPEPFQFKRSDTSALPRETLYLRCYQWMRSFLDTLKKQMPAQDSLHGHLMAVNIAATTDISYDITVTIKKGRYDCTLNHYIFHTVNLKRIPVNKAAALKEYRRNVNIQRVEIMRNHLLIFRSLKDYIHKMD